MSEPTAGISEPCSEKRKRGRPRVLTAEQEAFIRASGSDVTTRRGMRNMIYEGRAQLVLREEPDAPRAYRWLIGAGDKDTRRSVLAELDRFEDPDAIRTMARAICQAAEGGMSSTEAKARLRRARLTIQGREPKPASAVDLAETLFNTIERCQAEHPDCAPGMADAALWRVLDVVRVAIRAAEEEADTSDPAAAEP